jgi:HK97 family phage major capsid protein
METSTKVPISDDAAIRTLLRKTRDVLDRDEHDERAGALLNKADSIAAHSSARNLPKAILRGAELQAGQDEERYRSIFHRYLVHGVNGLEAEERQALQRRKAPWAQTQASGPNWRAQGVASGPVGGYTVPKAFVNQVEESLKHFSAMRQVSTVMTTETGRNMPWPTVNDTTQVGELLAENAVATEQDVTFAQIVFGAYKYSSKIVRCSRELLEDAAPNIETVLTSLFARRIGVLQNLHFTVGGVNKSLGAVTSVGLGKTGTTGVIFDDLVDLVHSIDPLYRTGPSVAWMMADSTLQAARKVKDTAGAPIVVSPTAPGTAPAMILGYPVVINPDMSPMGSSAKSILFGDFSQYIIRDSLEMAVLRLSERYAEFGQVGFLAFMRSDGRTLDSGTDPIKYFQNAA